ncbi:MAG: hypothetical protein J6R36_00490, partial [Bacteroidaceae bacterium]|nr:hypothetical protein [Bacteroidaceae bacterium]
RLGIHIRQSSQCHAKSYQSSFHCLHVFFVVAKIMKKSVMIRYVKENLIVKQEENLGNTDN